MRQGAAHMLEVILTVGVIFTPVVVGARVFYVAVQSAFAPTVDTCRHCGYRPAPEGAPSRAMHGAHAVERSLRLVA